MNAHKQNHDQGECDPVPEQQQQSETDLSRGAPPTQRGVADHPNREWSVIEPDSSYIPRPGPSCGRFIMPWQVNAVVGTPADRVDGIIAQAKDLEETNPLTGGGPQADPQRPAVGSGQNCGKGSYGLGPSDAQAGTNSTVPQGPDGEFSSRQGLIERVSGISLDGFPSRSVEEGGVSGLFQCESGHASDCAAIADSPSSSSTSDALSGMTTEGTLLQTARTVTIRPVRPDHPFEEQAAVHRLPLPAELDRMDERLEDALQFWTDVPRGTVAPTQASEEDKREMLTGNRASIAALPDQDRASWSDGQLGPPSPPGPHYTQGRPPLADHADGRPTNVEHVQPQPASTTPSESSIAETVFDVRRPTPPPQLLDVASLPSSQRHAVTAAGPSGWLRRGDAYIISGVEQEEAVPAVLVPGGGWLGLGGGHSPPQVGRRKGRSRRDDEEERRRRETCEKKR